MAFGESGPESMGSNTLATRSWDCFWDAPPLPTPWRGRLTRIPDANNPRTVFRSKLAQALVLGTLVVTGIGSGCATAPAPKSNPAFEYKSITGLLASLPGGEGRLDERITKKTEEGWELVTVGHLTDNMGYALFRRPKQ
jgi:hypothetical protein